LPYAIVEGVVDSLDGLEGSAHGVQLSLCTANSGEYAKAVFEWASLGVCLGEICDNALRDGA